MRDAGAFSEDYKALPAGAQALFVVRSIKVVLVR